MPRDIPKANSYAARVKAVNEIYDRHAKSGMNNRDIWRRFVYPRFGIAERTYYNYLKKTVVQPTTDN